MEQFQVDLLQTVRATVAWMRGRKEPLCILGYSQQVLHIAIAFVCMLRFYQSNLWRWGDEALPVSAVSKFYCALNEPDFVTKAHQDTGSLVQSMPVTLSVFLELFTRTQRAVAEPTGQGNATRR